jgi:hypothetical protein
MVDTRNTRGCWEWTGAKNAYGYGAFNAGPDFDRKVMAAHRFSWIIHHGSSIPPKMDICHHCDNPKCVRPDHLFLGTRQDNVNDMMKKGRYVKGRRPSGPDHYSKIRGFGKKLTSEQAMEIRASSLSCKELAEKYSVSSSTISEIRHFKSWRH